MSAPAENSPEAEPILARNYAVRIGLLLLVGFAAVIAGVGYDEGQMRVLETFEETTAVGDRAYFQMPTDAVKPPPAAVSFRGQPLFPVSYAKVELRDTRMTRAGMADDAAIQVYTSRDPVPPQEGESEKHGTQFYFLKVERDEYIKVRAGSPGM